MKKSLSILLRCLMVAVPLLLYASSAQAQTVAMGADLSYEKVSGSAFLYRFTFKEYVAICPILGLNYAPVPLHIIPDSCNGFVQPSFPLTLDTIVEISDFCPAAVTNCDSTGSPLKSIYAFVFSGTVSLDQYLDPIYCPSTSCWIWCEKARGLPPPINLDSLLAIDKSSLQVWAPDSTLENSSVVLNAPPLFSACVNDTVIYNQQAVDPDGDSLVFTLQGVYGDAVSPEYYAAGYSGLQPFGINNPYPATMDPVTGELRFKADSVGLYAIGYMIEEYRTINGAAVKVGYRTREIEVKVGNCTSPCPFFGNVISTGSGTQVNSNAMTLVNPGANVELSIPAHSSNPNLSLTMTSNCTVEIPGSTFTVSGTGTNVTGQFNWSPTAADVRPAPYYFTYRVKDNACPVPNQRYGAMRVLVTNSVLSTPEAVTSEVIIPNVLTAGHAWVLPADLQGAQIKVFDAAGKQVYTSGSYNNRFTGEGLSSGLYLYQITPAGTSYPISGQLSLQR